MKYMKYFRFFYLAFIHYSVPRCVRSTVQTLAKEIMLLKHKWEARMKNHLSKK